MNFNTLEFIVFLPVVLALFYLSPPRFRMGVLLLASLFFYGVSGFLPLTGLLVSILWGFVTAFLVTRHPGRAKTILAVALPLFFLFIFKYLDFTLTSVAASDGTRDFFGPLLMVVMPAGISFYTFQIVSYSLDVADGKLEPEKDLVQFATFISFFPQLIAGPILRYDQIRDQFRRISTDRALHPDVVTGLKFICVGFAAKIFFADMLSSNLRFNAAVTTPDAIYSVFSYSFRIYYDFWAYSLMAIGLAKLFSIDLPRNFREPYLAANPQDFWRRWHVTLSYWLRDYVYIRLGGNRAYIRNIVIVFLACGLWHGAGWNFVIWGAYHAVLVAGYRLVQPAWDRLPNWAGIALTFLLVSLGWPLFNGGIADYAELMATIFSFDFSGPSTVRNFSWILLGIVAAVTFLTREDKWLFNEAAPRRGRAFIPRLADNPVSYAAVLSLAVVCLRYRDTFIYFRF